MLIGICGGICAGKKSVACYLIEKHGFQLLTLERLGPGPLPEHTFDSVSDMVDYATTHWQSSFVMTEIWSEEDLDTLARRPFFLLVSVDAPISMRWSRFQAKCAAVHLAKPPKLENFVLSNDDAMYDASSRVAAVPSRAQVKLLNNTSSLDRLYATLDKINLPDQSRLRPTWDHYFMRLASLAAHRSNCMRRQVGCVLVREKRVISTGYNGTPRGIGNCNEGGCPRCNNAGGASGGGVALSTCLCIHAEENALLEAGRERVGGGAVLYCNT
ncbi:Deoxycytidine monophosphate (dCMP) deaminase [Elasticomyces elasticus]|nr:Deoxycytidine monophosphate (dCMP) deaminase [Elasticomyces elasticus]